MTRHAWWIQGLVLAMGVAGCGGDQAIQPSTTATPPVGGSGAGGGASTAGTGAGGGIEVFDEGPGNIPGQSLLNTLVVYFEFDRSDILAEFNEVLAAHGDYLSSNPGARLRLEGHADERGTREYNIGLGERRAQAVRRVLLLQGAASDQMGTVSYGEERPAALGGDEESYQLNRRVELVYQQ